MTDEITAIEFSPQFTPAVIEVNFEAMREKLDRMIEPYRGMDEAAIAKMDAKEAKACRADLNKIIANVEEGRKGVKRAYNEPLQQFEAGVRALLEPAVEARDMIDGYVKDKERIEKELLRQGLERTYEDFAPALVEVVPFERVLAINPKWLNKSYGAAKAAEEMQDAVAGIAKDWEAFKALSIPFKDEAEAVFFRELSLQKAIEHVQRRKEEQARIDALRAEVEANRAVAVPEPAIWPETEPEPPQTPDIVAQAERCVASVCEPKNVYVLALEMTESEKVELIGHVKGRGIHGSVARCGFESAEAAMECMKEVVSNG